MINVEYGEMVERRLLHNHYSLAYVHDYVCTYVCVYACVNECMCMCVIVYACMHAQANLHLMPAVFTHRIMPLTTIIRSGSGGRGRGCMYVHTKKHEVRHTLDLTCVQVLDACCKLHIWTL